MLSFFKKSNLIGLDIQQTEVRLLQLQQTQRDYAVKNFAATPLPHGAIHNGNIQEFEVVTNAIKKTAELLSIKKAPVAMALPMQNIISKMIQLPIDLKKFECEIEIKNNLPHYFSGITEELLFDFMIMNEGLEQYDVFVIAARAESVMSRVKVVQAANLTVQVVDCDLFAAIRVIKYLGLLVSPISVFMINHHVMQFSILKKGEIIYNQAFEAFSWEERGEQLRFISQIFFALPKTERLPPVFVIGSVDEKLLQFLQKEFSANITVLQPFGETNDIPANMTISYGLAMRGFNVRH